jgi:hypothetical protein
VPAADLPAYDAVVARQGRLAFDLGLLGDGPFPESAGYAGPYFGALLNSPELAEGIARMGTLVRTGERRGAYTNAERELADMVLSTDFGYTAILALHIPDALAVGVRLEAIEAIRAGQADELTDDEAQLVAYIRQVVSGQVTDESWAGMARRFGERGAIEYTAFISWLLCTMRLWQALDVPGPGQDAIDAMLADYRAGRRALPDREARIH